MTERGSERIGPRIHFGGERSHHLGLSFGKVVRLGLVARDVVQLEAIAEAMQLPAIGAERTVASKERDQLELQCNSCDTRGADFETTLTRMVSRSRRTTSAALRGCD